MTASSSSVQKSPPTTGLPRVISAYRPDDRHGDEWDVAQQLDQPPKVERRRTVHQQRNYRYRHYEPDERSVQRRDLEHSVAGCDCAADARGVLVEQQEHDRPGKGDAEVHHQSDRHRSISTIQSAFAEERGSHALPQPRKSGMVEHGDENTGEDGVDDGGQEPRAQEARLPAGPHAVLAPTPAGSISARCSVALASGSRIVNSLP